VLGCGVTAEEAVEATDCPIELVALTVNVYDVPLVSPVIECESAVVPAFVSVPPDGIDVTVYPVMVLPPLDEGARNDTVAFVLPATAEGEVGAPGTTALEVYVRLAGLVSPPLFDGVRVILPATVGVIVNV